MKKPTNKPDDELYDLIIVGAGPAGITAAIYAARKKMKTAIITKDIGGKAQWSGEVSNYTGFQIISGQELTKKFEEHLRQHPITIINNTEVNCAKEKSGSFIVTTDTKTYITKTVIIATGRTTKYLGIPGEKEYKNKGVTYCATCDGPLFAEKDVAIIGGGNSALDATIQMIPIAKKIFLITQNPKLEGDSIMIEKVKSAANVEIITKAVSRKITGDKFVNGIEIMINKTENRKINVEGILIEIGSIPVKATAECQGVDLNDDSEIIVNDKCETNVLGIYAAGDVTSVPEKQIIVASGQGCIAANQAFKYLARKKEET